MVEEKKAIKINYPKFDMSEENPYAEEMDRLVNEEFAQATTAHTLKEITDTLAKSLKSKYGIKDKEELKAKVNAILKVHGLAPENFDPLSMISKLTFGRLQTVNDVSVDANANKDVESTNMTGVCIEASLAYNKLAGYDYLYQTLKELYGKETAKQCSASMYDMSLMLHDSTRILMPYCYCIDASKLVIEGRKFGQVHSSPAKRMSTYVSVLGDTIREISFNIAGACAIGTFFLDLANLGIYRERITLDDLRTDKKTRKYVINCIQQFIHTVNHFSRSATESPFTNISLFDRDKLTTLINDDNYGWYFPKKAAVIEDNSLEDTKDAFKNFVLDYIEELQEMYIDIFDAGDPLRPIEGTNRGLQFPFPVTTVNLSIEEEADGSRHLSSENNRLLEYITKKDVTRYNQYCDLGTRVASCCRLISDAEMLSLGEGVNSFGGSQVSLGSHRVVTVDLFRAACEATSYDDFKNILSLRIEEAAKILKAHRILIMKLEELGTQPWITNGMIQMSHLFSTFGVGGYVEAAELLHAKFNHQDFDYMKDFMHFFSEKCKEIAQKENIVHNVEAVPFESGAYKVAGIDKLLFGNEKGEYEIEGNENYIMPDILANQWCSLWENYTIREKMKRDGEIQRTCSGGSLVHVNVDSDITSTQAKKLIKDAISNGMAHFALNSCTGKCLDCGFIGKGHWEHCPKCASKHVSFWTRIIGYMSWTSNWAPKRREKDFPRRKFMTSEEIKKDLGK